MKEGLTYISERTNQLRYSDKNNNEKWLHPLSEYIPLTEVKRGQPLSIATPEDIAEVEEKLGLEKDALANLTETFVVPTDTARHSHAVGLAMEYSTGVSSVELCPAVHILSHGRFDFDVGYSKAAGYSDSVKEVEESTEYFPEFLRNYKENIGKTVYVKGFDRATEDPSIAAGLLTVNPEEAYFAYHSIIEIGHISDATINGEPDEGSIELQIEGDTRGPVDSTQFEAILGEDVLISKDKNSTRLFALGNEGDSKFSFKLGYNANGGKAFPKNGFIAIQRLDGATSIVCPGGAADFTKNTSDFSLEDINFLATANSYEAASEEAITTQTLDLSVSVEPTAIASVMKSLSAALSTAFANVSYKKDIIKLDGSEEIYPKCTKLVPAADSSDDVIKATSLLHLEADQVGGHYALYVSSNLRKLLPVSFVESSGSYYNKGYAVLADIRTENRQNIIGVYCGGNYGNILPRNTKALFMKNGMFRAPTAQYEPGVSYYLDEHGQIVGHPTEKYLSVVKIGTAQTDTQLILSIDNAREYLNGDLPVGYMKPSVDGKAEFGFILMDGHVESKDKLSALYTKLQLWYSEDDLAVLNQPDKFKIPEVYYEKYTGQEQDGKKLKVYAQVKYLANGIFNLEDKNPFIRHTYTECPTITTDGNHKVEIAGLKSEDVTSLVVFGPNTSGIVPPELEMLDIRLFVNVPDDRDSDPTVEPDAHLVQHWIEVHPGFHMFNNTEYYGFEWRLRQTKKPNASALVGEWTLDAITQLDDRNKKIGLGPCILKSPYSPPTSIKGLPYKIFIARRDYYPRQFDVEALFDSYVKDTVLDGNGTPWSENSVSGEAVQDYIFAGVHTEKVELAKNAVIKNDEGTKLSTVDLKLGDNCTNITGNFNLYSPIESTDLTLKFTNGLFSLTDRKGTALEAEKLEALEKRVLSEDTSFVLSKTFKDHTSSKITEDSTVHGLTNGPSGNINAASLHSLKIGSPGKVVDDATGVDGVVTYLNNDSQGNWTIGLGNIINYSSGYGKSVVGIGSTVIQSDRLTHKFGNNNGVTVISDANGDLKLVDAKTQSQLVNLYTKNSASSAKFKNIYKEFLTAGNVENADVLYKEYDSDRTNVEDTDSKALMTNALQAVSAIPLGLYKYKNEDTEDKKKFFGIIIERIEESKNLLKEGTFPAVKVTFKDDTFQTSEVPTTFDKYESEYIYTPEQQKSMAVYLDSLTNNNEETVNVLSTVGLLLEATKESYNRMLLVERSLYGADCPTIPGNKKDSLDNKIPEYASPTPSIFGLNRLIKALCAEVFQVADPDDLVANWDPNNSDHYFSHYSRLDQIDKDIYGEGANNDIDDPSIADTEIHINKEKGSTYPDEVTKVERSAAYTPSYNNVESGLDYGTRLPETEFQLDSKVLTPELTDAISSGLLGDTANFNGINNTVNRIVTKLDRLTEEVNGDNNINNGPILLDRLRDNIETVIKELFYENYFDNGEFDSETEDKAQGSFFKSKLSRIDTIAKELYSYTITTDNIKNLEAVPGNMYTQVDGVDKDSSRDLVSTKRKFNNKSIKGKITENSDSTAVTEFTSTAPETIEDYSYATIIDLIVDLLSKDEKLLVRGNSGIPLQESNKDPEQAFLNRVTENKIPDNSKAYREGESLIDRVAQIETVLDAIVLRFRNLMNFDCKENNLTTERVENKTKLRNTEVTVDRAYDRITSIDDFMSWIGNYIGVDIYRFDRVNPQNTILSIKDKELKDPWDSTESAYTLLNDTTATHLHNAVYDIASRVMANEHLSQTVDKAIGAEYQVSTATFEDFKKKKLTQEGINKCDYTNEYSISSDLKALLSLIYGQSAPGKANHFKDSDLSSATSNLLIDWKAANPLEPLYKQLYVTYELIPNGSANKVYNFDKGPTYKTEYLLEGTEQRRDLFNNNNDLGGAIVNRFAVIEQAIKATRSILGFNTDNVSNQTGAWSISRDADIITSLNGSTFDKPSLTKYEFGNTDSFYSSSTVLPETSTAAAKNLLKLIINTYNELLSLEAFFKDFNKDIKVRAFNENEWFKAQTGLNDTIKPTESGSINYLKGGINKDFEDRIKALEVAVGKDDNDPESIDNLLEATNGLYKYLYGDNTSVEYDPTGSAYDENTLNFADIINSYDGKDKNIPTATKGAMADIYNQIVSLESRISSLNSTELKAVSDGNVVTLTKDTQKDASTEIAKTYTVSGADAKITQEKTDAIDSLNKTLIDKTINTDGTRISDKNFVSEITGDYVVGSVTTKDTDLAADTTDKFIAKVGDIKNYWSGNFNSSFDNRYTEDLNEISKYDNAVNAEKSAFHTAYEAALNKEMFEQFDTVTADEKYEGFNKAVASSAELYFSNEDKTISKKYSARAKEEFDKNFTSTFSNNSSEVYTSYKTAANNEFKDNYTNVVNTFNSSETSTHASQETAFNGALERRLTELYTSSEVNSTVSTAFEKMFEKMFDSKFDSRMKNERIIGEVLAYMKAGQIAIVKTNGKAYLGFADYYGTAYSSSQGTRIDSTLYYVINNSSSKGLNVIDNGSDNYTLELRVPSSRGDRVITFNNSGIAIVATDTATLLDYVPEVIDAGSVTAASEIIEVDTYTK